MASTFANHVGLGISFVDVSRNTPFYSFTSSVCDVRIPEHRPTCPTRRHGNNR